MQVKIADLGIAKELYPGDYVKVAYELFEIDISSGITRSRPPHYDVNPLRGKCSHLQWRPLADKNVVTLDRDVIPPRLRL